MNFQSILFVLASIVSAAPAKANDVPQNSPAKLSGGPLTVELTKFYECIGASLEGSLDTKIKKCQRNIKNHGSKEAYLQKIRANPFDLKAQKAFNCFGSNHKDPKEFENCYGN